MPRFEYVAGSSSKFWEITVRGTAIETCWGRIGTAGQRKTARLGSPALAEAAAAKQVREKLAKGYVQAEGKKAAPKPAAKPARAAKPAQKATSGNAGSFSFTAEQDARYARGWPHLRVLVDRPPPRGGAARAAKRELDAIDPVFAVEVHRDVATVFLRAMTVDRKDAEARAQAIATPAPIDEAVLEAIVNRLCPSMTENYQFRIVDAVWLLEAFLGAERVAKALVARFALAANDKKLWNQLDNPHDHAYHLAHAFGFLRLRMTPARWQAIIAPLRAVKKSNLLFTERLALFVDPKLAVRQNNEAMRMITPGVALERGDPAALRAYFARWPGYWHSPRFFYIVGADLLDESNLTWLPRLPAWSQQRVALEYGTIRHRATVRVMMWLLSARSAKQEAADWLRAHADFARPVLEEVHAGDDAKERKLASAALAVLGGTKAVKNKHLSEAQVRWGGKP